MQYLEEQPEVWKKILYNREELFHELSGTCLNHRIHRVLLVGSGSSYNASLLAAQFYEEELGLEATAVVPTKIGALPSLLNRESTLVFAVSQSGRSTSTIHVIDTLRKSGFTVVGITADAASPIAGACDLHQLIDCGEETVGPKTKGMTATVLTLYLAGMCLCKTAGHLDSQKESFLYSKLTHSFDAAPENIARCVRFCKDSLKELSENPHFTLISDSTGYATACEGALKVLETLYVPACAYEFEEYLHGVNNIIAPGVCNLFVPVSPDNYERMQKLDDYCRKNKCSDFVITSAKNSGFTGALELEGSNSIFTQPFETLLFFQVLSALGSEEKGIDCDKPKFSDFYSLLETKA